MTISKSKTGYAIADNILLVVGNFAVNIFIIRSLPVHEYGIFVASFLGVNAFVDIFTNGFLNQGMIKYSSLKNKEDTSRVIIGAILLKLAVLLIIMILLLPLSGSIEEALKLSGFSEIIKYTIAFFVIAIFRFSFQQAIISKIMIKQLFVCDFFAVGLSIITIYITHIYFTPQKALDALFLYSIFTSSFVISYSFVIKSILDFKLPSIEELKKLISFGRFTTLSALSSYLFERFDGYIIVYYLNPASLGAFDSMKKISVGIIKNLVKSFSMIVFPSAVRMYDNYDIRGIKELLVTYVALLFLICLLFALSISIFCEDIVVLLIGNKYVTYSYYLQIFSFGIVFRPFSELGGNIIVALGKPQLSFYFTSIVVSISILINAIFIPVYGLTAAVVANSQFYILNAIIIMIYLYKSIDLKPIDFITVLNKQFITHYNN